MPKTSPLTCGKILGNFFVIFVLLVISFIYSNVFRLYWPRRAGTLHLEMGIQVFLSTFHLSLFLLLWSFFKAMLTDPGIVPPLWGFYMGDSENKRRRYCLMCHVFKPERCHHCSACNRCVLNMDHHCRKIQLAWINNCVGFYNRKFFILLLVYVLISSYQALIALAWPVKEKIVGLVKSFAIRLSKLSPSDPFRSMMTDALLLRLYNLSLIPTKKSLLLCEKLTVSCFCRRRLSTLLVRLKMSQSVSFFLNKNLFILNFFL